MKNKYKPRYYGADVDVAKTETLYQDYFRVDKLHLKHRTFEGGWTGDMTREVFERGHAVTVVLFDPERDETVLIEQFRPGAYTALQSPWWDEKTDSPWLIETMAGIIDAGETPEEVARREAIEEAGCKISDLVAGPHYFATPGGSSESVYVFCGRIDSHEVGGIHGLQGEHEDIRAFVVPVTEAFDMLDEGVIKNSMTLVALQWFRANHQKLRQAFLKKT